MNLLSKNSKNEPEKEKLFNFKEYEMIFTEKDSLDYLYIIKYGKVRLFQFIENRIITLNILTPGDFLGDGPIFNPEIKNVFAMAENSTQLVGINKKFINKEIGKLPDWLGKLMNTLATRVNSAENIMCENKFIDTDTNSELYLSPKEENKIKEIIKKGQAS